MSDHGRIPPTSGGDDGEWMDRFTLLPDHEVDALLEGRVLPEHGDLAPVAALAAELRRRAAQEPVPPMSEALRAQIVAGPGAAVVPLDRARLVRRPLIGAAVAAAVVLVALVAGASQEVLPDSVQRIMSSVAERVGIDLPSPDDPETSDGSSRDGEPGAPEQTPGGAVPADPGTPGDGQPATPATPPAGGGQSNGGGVDPETVDNNGIGNGNGGGQGQGNGQGNGGGQGQGQGTGGGQGSGQGQGTSGNNASEQGQTGGTGTSGGGSSASGQGQQQGTGTGKGPKG